MFGRKRRAERQEAERAAHEAARPAAIAYLERWLGTEPDDIIENPMVCDDNSDMLLPHRYVYGLIDRDDEEGWDPYFDGDPYNETD